MNAISFKKWVSTILLLAITISLCGCSTNRTAASQDEHLTTTTAFIVLNGANVPALNSSAIASIYCRFPDLTVSPCMTCSLINSKSDLAPCYAALLQIGPS